MKRMLTAVAVLAAIVVVGAYGWVWKEADDQVEAAITRLNEAVLEALPAARKAMPKLRQLAILRQQRPGGDAGPFLNPKVRYRVPSTDGQVLLRPVSAPTVYPNESGLNDAVRRFPLSAEERESFTSRLSRLDFGWLRQLRRYGRWTLSPPTTRYQPSSEYVPETLTLRRDLRRAARLRLLQGLATGTAQEAIDDVEHLAWLLMTTERQPTFDAALELADDARIAREAAQLPITFTKDDHMTLFKIARGAIDGFLPGLREDTAAEARAIFAGTPMFCLGANRAAAFTVPVSAIITEASLRHYDGFDYDPGLFLAAQQKGCVLENFDHMTRKWEDLRKAGTADAESAFLMLRGEDSAPPPAAELFSDHQAFLLGAARVKLRSELGFLTFEAEPHPWEQPARPDAGPP